MCTTNSNISLKTLLLQTDSSGTANVICELLLDKFQAQKSPYRSTGLKQILANESYLEIRVIRSSTLFSELKHPILLSYQESEFNGEFVLDKFQAQKSPCKNTGLKQILANESYLEIRVIRSSTLFSELKHPILLSYQETEFNGEFILDKFQAQKSPCKNTGLKQILANESYLEIRVIRSSTLFSELKHPILLSYQDTEFNWTNFRHKKAHVKTRA